MQTKQRRILHIDFNSYFASVEQQANPFLRYRSIGIGGKPGGKGIVAAPSIQAKRNGIKTAMSVREAEHIDATLLMLNGDGRKYSEMTDRMISILSRHSPIIEQTSIDEAYLDLTDVADDWLESIAIGLEIRDAVRKEIGPFVTVSIGIGDNKLVAKMASDAEKPNGFTIVYPEDRKHFIAQRTLSDIPGIGSAILRRLIELGIGTPEQLRHTTLPFLQKHFKQYGLFLFHAARGLSYDAVVDTVRQPKSIGHAYTLPQHTSNPETLRKTLLSLADRVARRLRTHGLSALGFTAHVRFPSLRFTSRRGRFSAPTHDGLTIFHAAWEALQSHVTTQPIRLIGVTAHTLVPRTEQLNSNKSTQKQNDAARALDKIDNHYGRKTWTRASLLDTKLKERASGLHFDHLL